MAEARAQFCYGFPLKKINKKLKKAIHKYEEDDNCKDDEFIFNDCVIEYYGTDSDKCLVSVKTFDNFNFDVAKQLNITDIVETSQGDECYKKLMSFASKFDIKIHPDDIGWYLMSALF